MKHHRIALAAALLICGALSTAGVAQQTTNPPVQYPTATGTFAAPGVAQGSLDQNGKFAPTSLSWPTPITPATEIATYRAADVNIANTGAGDVFCLAGSATKTVRLSRIHVSATASSAIVVNVSVIKRSTLDTGGTPVAETEVPLDSGNPAATATATGYTVSPTAGTAVGPIDARKVAIGVQGNTATVTEAFFTYGDAGQQSVELYGVNENVCVNVGAAGTGASWAIYFEWTER